ncbi:RDD family protein [Ideonella livida]|uniref:RDD family protein n=1 Tax=Ideonella livida TaxID=2707176 RepID=A0A7C9TJN7_9BURK|nr:RDD family protein [Ideonella livida]NDY90745.1 RDD family protein [Ideonella livida]
MSEPLNSPQAPGYFRRLAAFTYEGILLFGLLMVSGLIYSVATNMRHGLRGSLGLQVFEFLVLGVYFVWFWTHGGQTVATKAWHLRVERQDGGPVQPLRAACRYLLSWVWFAPALLTLQLAGLKDAASISTVLLSGVLGYAALGHLRKDRQLPHDVLCGTRVVQAPPRPKA